MIIYILLIILLCIILWQFRQKVINMIGLFIGIVVLIISGHFIYQKIENVSLQNIPYAIINTQIGNVDIIKKNDSIECNINGKLFPIEEKKANLNMSLKNSYNVGLIGNKSFEHIERLISKSNFNRSDVDEYYIGNKLYSSSLFRDIYKHCGEDNDFYILVENTSNKTINYEKFILTARKKDHSTDLLDVTDRDFRNDRVIRPNEVVGMCYKFPNLRRQKLNIAELTLDINLLGVSK